MLREKNSTSEHRNCYKNRISTIVSRKCCCDAFYIPSIPWWTWRGGVGRYRPKGEGGGASRKRQVVPNNSLQ